MRTNRANCFLCRSCFSALADSVHTPRLYFLSFHIRRIVLMASPVSSQMRAKMETNLLRFLCAARSSADARLRVLLILQNYCWSTPDAAVFFECIRDLFACNSQTILANLAATLTRRGFPDMPCEILAKPSKLTSVSALKLAEKLLHPIKTER